MSMKNILIALLLCLPASLAAQTEWDWLEIEEPEPAEETKDEEGKTISAEDAKYLYGAVPEEDGRVVFRTVIEAPGKSASQIYAIIHAYMEKMTRQKNQIDQQSRIVIEDSIGNNICGVFQEWLNFRASAIELDRTRFFYNLIARCSDGKAELSMVRIRYLYEENRDPQTYNAEEWITDKYAINKKNKLTRMNGKFRKKTIDRKDYIFQKFAQLLNE